MKVARAGGFNTLWRGSDGINYAPPGGGYSTARVSSRVVSQMDRLWDQVRHIHVQCHEQREAIARKLGARVGRQLDELHLELRIGEDGRFLVEETKTGVRFPVPPRQIVRGWVGVGPT